MGMLKAVLVFLRAPLIPKAHLAVENLALRQQLAVLKQPVKRPKLRPPGNGGRRVQRRAEAGGGRKSEAIKA